MTKLASSAGSGGHRGSSSSAGGRGLFGWMKRRAKLLKSQVLAVHYAMEDERTPWYAKVLPLLAVALALSPLDLIPDFIPVLGLLDDLLLVPALLWLAIKLVPSHVMADARLRSIHEPLRLARSWATAAAIFGLWLAGLDAVLWLLLTRYGRSFNLDSTRSVVASIAVVSALCIVAFALWCWRQLAWERGRGGSVSLLLPAGTEALLSATGWWGNGDGISDTSSENYGGGPESQIPQQSADVLTGGTSVSPVSHRVPSLGNSSDYSEEDTDD